jgi:hypothetical protein
MTKRIRRDGSVIETYVHVMHAVVPQAFPSQRRLAKWMPKRRPNRSERRKHSALMARGRPNARPARSAQPRGRRLSAGGLVTPRSICLLQL